MTLVKRLTIIVVDGRIAKVFYPVFPSDTNAQHVVEWLRERSLRANARMELV